MDNNHLYLVHHGIKGQKWGVRRFQNADGSLTAAGVKRYGIVQEAAKKASKFSKYAEQNTKRYAKNKGDWVKDDGIDYKKESIRISERQAKWYKTLAEKYNNMTKDVSTISKADLKEAKQFVNKAFFTDAKYSFYYSMDGTPGGSTEDHD